MISRANRGPLAQWLWTIDTVFLMGVLLLMMGGFVLSFAAGAPVAERLGVHDYYFVERQAAFLGIAFCVLIGTSMLTPRLVRRAALVVFLISLVLMVVTLFGGVEVKGARRWVQILGFSVQPSEFIKPCFVVLCAFILTETRPHKKAVRLSPIGQFLSFLLCALLAGLLVAQPDFGQMMLVLFVWCTLLFLAGISWFIIFLLGLLSLGCLWGAYRFLPHVTERINRFMDPSKGDTFQVDAALQSFSQGGWFGRGPGEGTVKRILPDAHTDFIFAVAGEEFGIVLCLVLLALFVGVVLRGLARMRSVPDPFSQLAACGLMALFGMQSVINMAVNLHLMPPKGMTLPFVSYGGSSLLATAVSMGMVLALTRRRALPQSTFSQFSSWERMAGERGGI